MTSKKKLIIGLPTGIVALTGIVGAAHHGVQYMVRNDQFVQAQGMQQTILNLIAEQSPESLEELRTQIQSVFTTANDEYKSLCKFVDRKTENIDPEDYLTKDQMDEIKNGKLSKEEFETLSHKGKEAAILYQMH